VNPPGTGPAWAIVLAAGGGTRFGGPKQFEDLAGLPMLEHPVRAAAAVCDGIVVVVPPGHPETWTPPAGVRLAVGGASRADSVRAGLAAVPPEAAVIVVTDAAHPLATPALYRRVVDAVRAGAGAAVPGLPLTEVVKEITVGQPTGTGPGPVVAGASLPRETHRMIQTPHAFAAAELRAAHAGAEQAVEDSAMVAARGVRVVVVDGEPTNIHVTTPAELAMARQLAGAVLTDGGVR
jgi:2-C-methyl-D-erythritol 4-phosphate cytidylyltransferase